MSFMPIHLNIAREIKRNRGENHRCAKISEATAQAILNARPDNYKPRMRCNREEVAAKHGVTCDTVTNIWTGRSWKDLRKDN